MEKYYNNFNVLQLLLKWKLHFTIIVLLSMILAAIFSSPMFITPKFKSSGIVYPANISPYAEESETEQMLQLFQSQVITDSVIGHFNLSNHYGIKPDTKYFRTSLLYEYGQNVQISKTPFDAVEIKVLDRNPQMACDMVNAIIHYYNLNVETMHKQKYREVMNMYETLIHQKEKRIDSINRVISHITKEYGLFNYSSISEEVAKGYLRTVEGANQTNINTQEVNRLRKGLETVGSWLMALEELMLTEIKELSILKVEYEQQAKFYNAKMTYVNWISKPFPAEKKTYPIRWIIVVLTGLATALVSTLTFIAIEKSHVLFKSNN